MPEVKEFAQSHYENFPVGSILIPKKLRDPIFQIYKFSRTADDIVDAENKITSEKEIELTEFRVAFENKLTDEMKSLWKVISEFDLSPHYFTDLLDAFYQDIHVSTYQSFSDIETYATKSADPVGRLLLELFNYRDEKYFSFSDDICSGLQFINFWQDISRDKLIRRFYIPLDILEKYNFTIDSFYFSEEVTKEHHLVVDELIEWTQFRFNRGKNLFPELSGRFKLELIAIWNGGQFILYQSKKMSGELLFNRPVISKPKLIWQFISYFFKVNK